MCLSFLAWKWFIYNRTQNVNKRTRSDDGAPPRKRQKASNNAHHFYPQAIPETADDDESHERNFGLLKDELSKVKPSSEVLKQLMSRTYPG